VGRGARLGPDALAGGSFPDARTLDAAVPDRPAIARRVDGHALWVNSAALSAARSRPRRRIPRAAHPAAPDGSPSGVLVDNAMALVVERAPEADGRGPRALAREGAAACARAGLTEVQDASGYDADGIAALQRLASRGALPIRVYATVSPDPRAAASSARGPHVGGGDDFLTVRAIKAYADGALGSRGAALLATTPTNPGKRGLLVTPPERLAEVALAARRAGWQLWIHAIGDRGNRVALDAYEKAAAALPRRPAGADRPRIEHAQVIARDDFARFARLSVIASIPAGPRDVRHAMGGGPPRPGAHRRRIRVAPAHAGGRAASREAATLRSRPRARSRDLRGGHAARPGRQPSRRMAAADRLTRAEASRSTRRAPPGRPSRRRGAARSPPERRGPHRLSADPLTAPESEIAAIRRVHDDRRRPRRIRAASAMSVGGRRPPPGGSSPAGLAAALSFFVPRRRAACRPGRRAAEVRPEQPTATPRAARAWWRRRSSPAACAIRACSPPCARVPRHLFVDAGDRASAYDDHPLPIGGRQTISQPYIVALMSELLALRPESRVLGDRNRLGLPERGPRGAGARGLLDRDHPGSSPGRPPTSCGRSATRT
jgi:hypothetical protein